MRGMSQDASLKKRRGDGTNASVLEVWRARPRIWSDIFEVEELTAKPKLRLEIEEWKSA